MYNDYPTIYESNLNLNFIYIGIVAIVILTIIIISLLALAKIFKKANRSSISAYIPIYNIWVLLEITNKPKWYLLLMLIPFLNLILYIILLIALAKSFRKSNMFALGMITLPFIFLPILAFSDSEYFGINLIAMDKTNIVANIPVIETKKEEPEIEIHNEKDQNLKNINISIGGGVYQKSYTNDLLNVDEKQTILKETEEQLKQIKKEELLAVNKTNTFIDSNLKTENNILDKQDEKKQTELEIPSIINENNINNNVIKESKIIPNEDTKPNNLITPIINSVDKEKDEFINCPKCGTKLKSSSKKCFLCGQDLN